VVRVANHTENERKKKDKDDRKKKSLEKARTQLDRGKWCQGLEEEDKTDEEEEEAYSSASPIPWKDLADEEEEPTGGDVPLAGPFPLHEREDVP
jgi:hypothetical protein